MSATPHSGGLFASLRRLGVTGVVLVRTRLALLATELQEEKERLLGVLVWGALALICLAVGTVFLSVFLTVLFWETHRLLALGIFSALFLGAGAIALATVVRLARAGTRLFAGSLAELERDQTALNPSHE